MSSQLYEKNQLYLQVLRRENTRAQNDINVLSKMIEVMEENVKNIDEYQIQIYMRMASSFSLMLQTFNSNVETLLASLDEETRGQIENGQLSEKSPCGSTNGIDDLLKFDLTSYKAGDWFRGFVTFISDSDKNLCFLKDVNKHKQIDFRQHIASELNTIPEYGSMFAIEMNAKVFRVYRINRQTSSTSISVRLIDIGETISISPNQIVYDLDEDAQQMPPIAILCCIRKVNGCMVNSLDSMNSKAHYGVKINGIDENKLQVDLYSEDDADDNNKSDTEPLINSPEPDNEAQPNNLNNSSLFQEYLSMNGSTTEEKYLPPVPPRAQLFHVPEKIEIPSHISSTEMKTPKRAQFTQQMVKLETNKLFSHNPFVDSKNDPIACFDSNNSSDTDRSCNECNTGAHPKKASVSVQDGFVNLNLSNMLFASVFAGQEVKIIPTTILTFDEIFVQLVEKSADFLIFNDQLQQQQCLEPLKLNPNVNDLVLAKYSQDGNYYRARVIDMVEYDAYAVFYLDYGNTEDVKVDDLFEWNSSCDIVPFQAIHCEIANMARVKNATNEEMKRALEFNCYDKVMKASIISKANHVLTIILKTEDGEDLVEKLFGQ